MECEAAQIIAAPLTLSRMDAGAQIESERFRVAGERACAFERGGRTGEGERIAIARMLDLASAMGGNAPVDRSIEMVEDIAPAVIAHGAEGRGRIDDIGKKDREQRASGRGCPALAGKE